MHRWNGRVALVTGASVGIGAGICKELVKHGMSVVGCARSVEKIQALANDEEVSKGPGKLHAIKCDLAHKSDILAMFDEIRQKFGRVDVCINNAALCIGSPFACAKTYEFDKMLKVNTLALCICTRESLVLMKEKNITDGQIIQMGCIFGHRIPVLNKKNPDVCFSVYNGTKFMARGLTAALREELKVTKSKIKVATISPGVVETQMMARSLSVKASEEFFSAFECLQPQDVAEAVTYILSAPPHASVEDVILQPIDHSV